QKTRQEFRGHRRLRTLWRAVRVVKPAAATVRFGWRTSLELRLLQREQRIHDALRLLAPYFSAEMHQRAREAARIRHGESRAVGLAGAIALQEAIDAYRRQEPVTDEPLPHIGVNFTDHLDAVAQALSRPRVLTRIRQWLISTESSTTAHV
ncbi:hypothetical protein NGM37_41290, partial [Streptomyces sp. TRM76130]|nr:hypothetical protein [Streptomyces sp. TRM76130]